MVLATRLLPLLLVASVSPAATMQTRAQENVQQNVQAGLAQQAQQMQKVLKHRATELKRAIWDELGYNAEQPLTQDAVDAASQLLVREAGYLAAEDPAAAAALSSYAAGPFVPLLALPLEPMVSPEPKLQLTQPYASRPTSRQRQSRLHQALESEEFFVQEDSKGQLVRTSRHCRGSSCMAHREVLTKGAATEDGTHHSPWSQLLLGGVQFQHMQDMPSVNMKMESDAYEEKEEANRRRRRTDGRKFFEEDEEVEEEKEEGNRRRRRTDGRKFFEEDEEADQERRETEDMGIGTDENEDIAQPFLKTAARSLAREIGNMMAETGLPAVHDIVGLITNSSAQATHMSDNTVDTLRDANTTVTGTATATAPASTATDSLSGTFQNLLNAVVPKPSRDASSIISTESITTKAVVENGKLTLHTRHCKQGSCRETTEIKGAGNYTGH